MWEYTNYSTSKIDYKALKKVFLDKCLILQYSRKRKTGIGHLLWRTITISVNV